MRRTMSRLLYDTSEALVYDPVSGNRMATRSALYSLGFRKIESASTVEAFCEALRRRPPDLAICETQGAEAELCAAIQALRQGAEGHNPFIVIIATAWEKNAALVSQVINSGADDLLLRPFSTSLLESRIATHIQRRKGFVVTSNYIGPDRRRESSRPSNVELFEPPNSLKMKAQDRLTPEQAAERLESELKVARGALNLEKIRRDAFQVCVQWRLIQNLGADPSYDEQLSAAADLVRGISKRCREADLDQACGWCDSLLAALEGLKLGVDRNASMHLFGHAARSLNQLFQQGKSAEEQLADIDQTVALIRARERPKLAS